MNARNKEGPGQTASCREDAGNDVCSFVCAEPQRDAGEDCFLST